MNQQTKGRPYAPRPDARWGSHGYTHIAFLAHPDLPLQAQPAHLFTGLTKALLSIGTL